MNDTAQTLHFEKLVYDDDRYGAVTATAAMLEDIQIHTGMDFVHLTLAPGEGFSWYDNHPVVPDMSCRSYVFYFKDEAGREVAYTCSFALFG